MGRAWQRPASWGACVAGAGFDRWCLITSPDIARIGRGQLRTPGHGSKLAAWPFPTLQPAPETVRMYIYILYKLRCAHSQFKRSPRCALKLRMRIATSRRAEDAFSPPRAHTPSTCTCAGTFAFFLAHTVCTSSQYHGMHFKSCKCSKCHSLPLTPLQLCRAARWSSRMPAASPPPPPLPTCIWRRAPKQPPPSRLAAAAAGTKCRPPGHNGAQHRCWRLAPAARAPLPLSRLAASAAGTERRRRGRALVRNSPYRQLAPAGVQGLGSRQVQPRHPVA